MAPEIEKLREFRLKEAQRAHDANDDHFRLHTAQIQTFSADAMKAPALVAVGGIAAALGFYSANYSRLTAQADGLAIFNDILSWLLLGLLIIVVAPASAYLSQLAYSAMILAQRKDWEHPFVHDTPKSNSYRFLGDVFRWLTVALVAASIICLIRGGYLFLRLVS